MLVSWDWLKEYVPLNMKPEEFSHRLMMAGLNDDGRTTVGSDIAINLEITSNRPDCLGHIGVAREVSVLFDQPMMVPAATPKTGSVSIDSQAKVTLRAPDLCPRYTARLIRGVKVSNSPAWLANRLRTIGIGVVNNIVDITNYVLFECGQPLHAFDFSKVQGKEIIVRNASAGEQLEAIDHRTYALDPQMCVIADATRALAVAGVMGGASSEVSPSTTDVLIESADFSPMSVRVTARKLGLHSPSSYRFERGVDPDGIDWASRRCCELILQLAGGELASGVISVGRETQSRQPVTLRLAQLKRILGIEIHAEQVRRILTALGCDHVTADAQAVSAVPPSWRRDLTREIDYVEEVARVHGYEAIPEDVSVPMAPSHRSETERVQAKVRQVLTGVGFDEAMTISIIRQEHSDSFSPWSSADAIVANMPILRGADRLRRSLIPSLLEARQVNESLQNPVIQLFETARIYLPQAGQLPQEQWTLGLVTGGDYYELKGVLETLVKAINSGARLEVAPWSHPLLHSDRACEVKLNGELFGYLGEVAPSGLKQYGLRGAATIAEINLSLLASVAKLIPQYSPQSPYPAIARDLNLIMDEAVRWSELSSTIKTAAGSALENLQFQEIYRDAKKDGEGKKRVLFSFTLREPDRTLTSEEADQIRDRVVSAAKQPPGAALRS